MIQFLGFQQQYCDLFCDWSAQRQGSPAMGARCCSLWVAASPLPRFAFAHPSGSHLLSRRPLLLLLLILLVPGSALAGAAPALWREGSLGGEEDGEGGGGD